MMKCIYLMCAPAGCGKSTWIKDDIAYDDSMIKAIDPTAKSESIVISRDNVRFSLVKDNEPYFSKENQVFRTWIKQINDAIKDNRYNHIYVDATHLNPKSRAKTLDALNLAGIHVVAVNILTTKDNAIERNAQRTGRECVPESVVVKMFDSFIPATIEEKHIDFVLNIVN